MFQIFCAQLQFSARTDLVLLLNFALGSSFFARAVLKHVHNDDYDYIL